MACGLKARCFFGVLSCGAPSYRVLSKCARFLECRLVARCFLSHGLAACGLRASGFVACCL